ncbi:MAG: hypothetical protein HOP14_14055 [Acidobacteria bacterium]|nr:hypothetical protein [Acidobacteriota bacterium]
MISLGAALRAMDAVLMLADAARRFTGKGDPSGESAGEAQPVAGTSPLAGTRGRGGALEPMESRIAGVVVAALQEAFDRDHRRLELEREHLEEERRRAEQAMRLERRRQAVDREVMRLRLHAGAALLCWLLSVLVLGFRLPTLLMPARLVLGAGWLALLAAVAAALVAERRVVMAGHDDGTAEFPGSSPLALWLLVLGLALVAGALLV